MIKKMSKYDNDREVFNKWFDKAKDNAFCVIVAKDTLEKAKEIAKGIKLLPFEALNGQILNYNRVYEKVEGQRDKLLITAFRDVVRRIGKVSLHESTWRNDFKCKYDSYTPLLSENILAYIAVKSKGIEEPSKEEPSVTQSS